MGQALTARGISKKYRVLWPTKRLSEMPSRIPKLLVDSGLKYISIELTVYECRSKACYYIRSLFPLSSRVDNNMSSRISRSQVSDLQMRFNSNKEESQVSLNWLQIEFMTHIMHTNSAGIGSNWLFFSSSCASSILPMGFS